MIFRLSCLVHQPPRPRPSRIFHRPFSIARRALLLALCSLLLASAFGGKAITVTHDGAIDGPNGVSAATIGTANHFGIDTDVTLSGNRTVTIGAHTWILGPLTMTSSMLSTGGTDFTSDGGDIDLGGGSLVGVGNGGIAFSGTGKADTITTLGVPLLGTANQFTAAIQVTSTPGTSGTVVYGIASGAGGSGSTIFRAQPASNTYVGYLYTGRDFSGSVVFSVNASGAVFANGGLTGGADTAAALATPRKIDGVAFDGTGNISTIAYGRVTTNWTSSSSTFSDVTGLSFAIGANDNYTADAVLMCQGTASNGLKFRVTGPTVSSVAISISGRNTTTFMDEIQTAFSVGSPAQTFGSGSGSAITVPVRIHIVTIGDGSHSGTVQIQADNVANSGTCTIFLNSDLSAIKTN